MAVIYRVVMIKHVCHRPACLRMSGLLFRRGRYRSRGEQHVGKRVENMTVIAGLAPGRVFVPDYMMFRIYKM